ncbi:MAG: polysaccharide biosynthesis C-terminal domain-containing protein, partial [Phycisphaerales bacterium JB038]
VMEAGIGGAVQRFLAGSYATGDREQIARQFNTGLVICLMLAALIAAAVIACMPVLTPAMTETPAQAQRLSVLLAWLLLALVLTMQTGLFATVLTAQERFVPVHLVALGVELARFGLFLLMLLRFDAGIVDLAIANAILETANLLCVSLLGKVLVGLPPLGRRYIDMSNTGRVLGAFAGWGLFITIAYILRARLDLAVAKVFIGFHTVAAFAVGATIASRVEGIVSQFGAPYTSRLSKLQALGDRKEMIEQYYRGAAAQESIAMTAGVGMIVFAPAFMHLWMGETLLPGEDWTEPLGLSPLQAATVVMQVLAWGWFLGMFSGLIGPLLRALNRMRTLSLLIFGEGVLNLALSILFVSVFDLGLAGIAAGTAVSATIVRTGIAPVVACHYLGEPLPRYWLRLQGPLLLIGAGAVLAGRLLRPEAWADSWLLFFVSAACFGTLVIGITCLLPVHPLQTWRRLMRAAKEREDEAAPPDGATADG